MLKYIEKRNAVYVKWGGGDKLLWVCIKIKFSNFKVFQTYKISFISIFDYIDHILKIISNQKYLN